MALHTLSRKEVDEKEERQRLARFYARRERFRKHCIRLGLVPIYYEVKVLEQRLGVKFDKQQFYAEVHDPKRCLIIE